MHTKSFFLEIVLTYKVALDNYFFIIHSPQETLQLLRKEIFKLIK